jgi:hypothetical protein
MKKTRGPGRPKMHENDRTVQFSLRLAPVVVERLKKRAEEKNLSTSVFVRQILLDKQFA